jgi:alpha-ketoglutarate-dependent taurine dioxygenase
MTITVVPVTPTFAAEVGDIDLSKKIEPADLVAINEAFIKYAVLIFPDQHLSQDQHLDFASHFGPLETTIALHRKDASLRLRKEFADVSNGSSERGLGRGQQSSHVSVEQPAVAYRQLIQACARTRIAALCAFHSLGRRPHGVRRRARHMTCCPRR